MVMGTIKQHIPNFVSGFDPVTTEFETLDELLSLDFVKRFNDGDNSFYRFSVNDYSTRVHLMAEYDEGRKWWVVGYIYGIAKDDIGLPQWKPNKGDK
jgi:hypothetical protein